MDSLKDSLEYVHDLHISGLKDEACYDEMLKECKTKIKGASMAVVNAGISYLHDLAKTPKVRLFLEDTKLLDMLHKRKYDLAEEGIKTDPTAPAIRNTQMPASSTKFPLVDARARTF